MNVDKGGVACLIKKSLVYTRKESHIDSSQVIGIELKSENECVYIFGVYLPTDGNVDSYAYEFNIVEGIYNCFSRYGCVLVPVVSVKLKTNVNKHESFQGLWTTVELVFLVFILTLLVKTLLSYKKQTVLDHILFEKYLINKLTMYKVFTECSISITSDHFVFAELE